MSYQPIHYNQPIQYQYQNQYGYFTQPPQYFQHSQPAYQQYENRPVATFSTPSTYSRSEVKQEYEGSAYYSADSDLSSPGDSLEEFEYDYQPRGHLPKHFGKAFKRGKKIHEFLATMLTYLKEEFLSVNKNAIEESYRFACRKEKTYLKKVMKEPLIKFLLEVADEIVSVDEHLSEKMYADAIVKTATGSTVIIDWKTGNCYPEDFSKMESMLEVKNIEEGYIFYLDDGRSKKIESKARPNPLTPFMVSLSRPVSVPELINHFGHTTYFSVLIEFLNKPEEPFNNIWLRTCLGQASNSWQGEGITALRDSLRALLLN